MASKSLSFFHHFQLQPSAPQRQCWFCRLLQLQAWQTRLGWRRYHEIGAVKGNFWSNINQHVVRIPSYQFRVSDMVANELPSRHVGRAKPPQEDENSPAQRKIVLTWDGIWRWSWRDLQEASRSSLHTNIPSRPPAHCIALPPRLLLNFHEVAANLFSHPVTRMFTASKKNPKRITIHW